MESMTNAQILAWLQAFATAIAQHKDYLTELDAAIGDADHGTNLDRGFKKVVDQLSNQVEQDIGTILKSVSMTLISSVGGASGPLYGTFFLKASAVSTAKTELSNQEVVELLKAGLDGVLQRGKAQLGDKTMIDVLAPAIATLEEAVNQGQPLNQALPQMVTIADQKLQDTVPMQARKGRASYLGERSIGHQDPGATSTYLLLKTLADTLTDQPTSAACP
jgi:phosphoenolpyruvate---glycerone phosphotransferase subunit DhaL